MKQQTYIIEYSASKQKVHALMSELVINAYLSKFKLNFNETKLAALILEPKPQLLLSEN